MSANRKGNLKRMPKSKKMIEEIAEDLHKWYLEATKELNPESYNSKAEKAYKDLTEEQKFIDRYIAKKILTDIFDNVMFSCMRGFIDATKRMEKEGKLIIKRDKK